LRTPTFTEFVKWHYERRPIMKIKDLDAAMLPHSHFVSNKDYPELTINHVGRYETLQEDFDKICDILSLPKEKLSHLNQARKYGKYPPYRSYYTEETKAMIADLYQIDIEAFGYKF